MGCRTSRVSVRACGNVPTTTTPRALAHRWMPRDRGSRHAIDRSTLDRDRYSIDRHSIDTRHSIDRHSIAIAIDRSRGGAQCVRASPGHERSMVRERGRRRARLDRARRVQTRRRRSRRTAVTGQSVDVAYTPRVEPARARRPRAPVRWSRSSSRCRVTAVLSS